MMTTVSIADLKSVVYRQLESANDAATLIKLSESTREKVAKSIRPMVADIPMFSQLHLGYAVQVWCVILFVDMRSSTKRAQAVGPKKTYLTMHGLLPALAHVVSEMDGYIVGFRGDGLFAAFGIDDSGKPIEGTARGSMVGGACIAGLTMIEAVKQVVNPALEDFGVNGDVKIGVGIDAGDVVITKIGLQNGFEVTAYGDCVNRAAKLCGRGRDAVLVSSDADDLIPVSKNGKLFTYSTVLDGDESGCTVIADGLTLLVP